MSAAVTAVLLILAALVFTAALSGAQARGEVGYDAGLYLDTAQRWLATGEFYYPIQFAGRYPAEGTVMLYPPLALYLLVPMSFLPRVLWWAIPLGIIGWHIWTARPAWWSWPVMAGCLALLPSSAILIYGNTDLWSAATLALACRFGWPAVALALKPTVFPLALLWARDRRWWLAAAGLGALALPFGALWLDYIAAMQNVDGSVLRSVNALPWLAIPLVAWLARVPEGADARRPLFGRVRGGVAFHQQNLDDVLPDPTLTGE